MEIWGRVKGMRYGYMEGIGGGGDWDGKLKIRVKRNVMMMII